MRKFLVGIMFCVLFTLSFAVYADDLEITALKVNNSTGMVTFTVTSSVSPISALVIPPNSRLADFEVTVNPVNNKVVGGLLEVKMANQADFSYILPSNAVPGKYIVTVGAGGSTVTSHFNYKLPLVDYSEADRSNILEVMQNNLAEVPINMGAGSKYSNLSATGKLNVQKALVEQRTSLTTVQSILNLFNITVDSEYAREYSIGSGSSGGGGGSGGRGKVINEVTLTSDLLKSDEKTNSFEDVNAAHWASVEIEDLYKKGIINGRETGKFQPDSFITREEFAKILIGALNITNSDAKCNMTDVSKDEWYYNAVAIAYTAGIVNGISEDRFGIGQNITRQDMAVMIYRAAKLKGIEFNISNEKFSDDTMISEYAKESVYSLVNGKIINGVGDNKFAPNDNATRAQAAKILYNILGGVGK